ncbi:MAG: adenine deaminase [Bacteroidales bacterium]
MRLQSNLVDIHRRKIYPAEIRIKNGNIYSIEESGKAPNHFILPGFVDAHIHIESSMVTPVSFSKAAIRHGTVAVVSDPHEIANVLGKEGVVFMVVDGRKTPLKIMFGAPSCVPATSFESSGAAIDVHEVEEILKIPGVGYLSEMMNYPGVLHGEAGVMEKIYLAKSMGVPIDGHAPGLTGGDLEIYSAAGISTDHECFTYNEAKEKISKGFKILIREGSGAKNFNALIPLLKEHPEKIMFCTDDLHPDDLLKGHINLFVRRAIREGYDLFDVLRAAGLNAAEHYNLEVGLLREGDPADFIIVDSLEDFNIVETFIDGKAVFSNETVNIDFDQPEKPNQFNIKTIEEKDLAVKVDGKSIRVIQTIDGELITKEIKETPKVENGNVISNTDRDVLKMAVVNRYFQSNPAIGFVNGFKLQKGALASSIAHDSHNIICVGTDDRYMKEAINKIIEYRGGIVAHDGKDLFGLPLEIAGIMSSGSVEHAAQKYSELTTIARKMGSDMKAPFMTLAFMALLVIPELKLSDKGLFSGNTFSFTSLFY